MRRILVHCAADKSSALLYTTVSFPSEERRPRKKRYLLKLRRIRTRKAPFTSVQVLRSETCRPLRDCYIILGALILFLSSRKLSVIKGTVTICKRVVCLIGDLSFHAGNGLRFVLGTISYKDVKMKGFRADKR